MVTSMYKGSRLPRSINGHGTWLDHRFNFSFTDFELLKIDHRIQPPYG